MIVDNSNAEKLLFSKQNLENFKILHDHQLWYEINRIV